MSRARSLRVLFVRPDDAAGLPLLFGFAQPRERADVLPVRLLELATAVMLGSPHRSFVHDARASAGGNREVRSVAAVHRADVAVIWMHPALLADGLEAARSARLGGCSLVLGAGPLISLWPEAARGAVELDGLISASGAPGLLAALDQEAKGGSARGFLDALARTGDLPLAARGVDRKLLDYAAYRGLPGGTTLPGLRVDKGRHAATPVPLHDGQGRLREVDELRRDLDACALLGIPRRALELTGGGPVPSPDDLQSLLQGRDDAAQYQVPVGEALEDRQLGRLRRLGVVTLSVGPVAVAPDSLELLGSRVAAWRGAGARVCGELVFGLRSMEVEEQGLEVARSLDVDFGAQLRVPLPPADEEARRRWGVWLGAPRADFHPPVPGGERRSELAERGRVLLGARRPAVSLTSFLGRIARVVRPGSS